MGGYKFLMMLVVLCFLRIHADTCCVLSAPSNQDGGDGHLNLKLFSLLGPQLPGLLQISSSCFV